MHYKNGREAKIGDRVVGRTYNRTGLQVGTVGSITPGDDSCSTLLFFSNTEEGSAVGALSNLPFKCHGTKNHGSAGGEAVTYLESDFTHCANLIHVDDLAKCSELLNELASQK